MDAISNERIERECTRFLYREAELLDDRKFHQWLELLSRDIDYRVPVRSTRANKDGQGFSKTAFFMEEDYPSLKLRVTRLDSEFAWSENPATRTRRLVGNIRVGNADDGNNPDRYRVNSNMVVYCYRGEAAAPFELTAERQDVLQRVGGEWKLSRRLVLLDSTVLGLESLSIFL